jgi:peptidoglycan LD-endopeptidase LytH
MLARRRTRMLAWGLAAATAVALIPPFDATADEYERVKRQKQALERDIEDVITDLDDLRSEIQTTADEIEELEAREAELEEEARAAKEALESRARRAFMRGGDTVPLTSLLTADGPTTAVERAGIVATLSRRDVAALEGAAALRIGLELTGLVVTGKRSVLAQLEQDLEVRGASLQQQFQVVSMQYRELRTRRERQRIISRGAQQGTYACIFDGAYHFRNTWGAPRSGGRRHRGTDVMAPFRAPVYAFTNGVVSRMSRSRLGGIGLYLRGDDGVQYFYAHLDGYAPGIHVGMRVEAGQHIGFNGYTGNASPSAPHVHFEVHPGGSAGSAVNPYHWLVPVCRG